MADRPQRAGLGLRRARAARATPLGVPIHWGKAGDIGLSTVKDSVESIWHKQRSRPRDNWMRVERLVTCD